MNSLQSVAARISLGSILALLGAFSSGCTTFSLADQAGVLAIPRHERLADVPLAIVRFDFDDGTIRGHESRRRWHKILATGLDQTNLFAKVSAVDTLAADFEGYTLTGRVRRFRFRQNWFPTFIPVHVGLSLFTLGGWTLLGGPTTGTSVAMTADFQLRDHQGEVIHEFSENYASVRVLNIYSSDAKNPYKQPNIAFAALVEGIAKKLESALPEEEASSPATNLSTPELAPPPQSN